ncbi:MAG: hypothetical protein ACOCRX_05595 [Candidatus Woesearchaeota archaeon]
MFSDKTKRKIRRSLLAAFIIFFIASYSMKTFSVGFEFFNLENLTKIFVYISVPTFALAYIIMEIIHKNSGK